ncbi:hypothetical protein ACFVUP_37945 [Streptomyces bacillaris]|uniref:hypothetical protein n=1 Tax=Streptomyces bacillaris TaxID=68179 RepID=UPI0036D8B62E
MSTQNDLAGAARRLLEADIDARVDAVRKASEAATEAEHAEARHRAAQAAHEAAWKDALTVGWNERELQRIGLRPPGKPSPRRNRAGAKPTQSTPDVGSLNVTNDNESND